MPVSWTATPGDRVVGEIALELLHELVGVADRRDPQPQLEVRAREVGGGPLLHLVAARRLVEQQQLRDERAVVGDRVVGRIALVERLVQVLHDVDDRVGLLDQEVVLLGLALHALDRAQHLGIADAVLAPRVEHVDEVAHAAHHLVDAGGGALERDAVGEVVEPVRVDAQPRDAGHARTPRSPRTRRARRGGCARSRRRPRRGRARATAPPRSAPAARGFGVRAPEREQRGQQRHREREREHDAHGAVHGHVRDRDDRRDLEREEAHRRGHAREQARRADQVERLHDRLAAVAEAREQRPELDQDVHGLGHAHRHEEVRHRAEHHVELPARRAPRTRSSRSRRSARSRAGRARRPRSGRTARAPRRSPPTRSSAGSCSRAR